MRQAAQWLFAVTGSSRAAEIGGIPTEDLIARFQKGQPRAFEALYDRYKDYVYRVAFFVLRNQQEAEDAVQETFLDLLKALPNYDIHGTARFETWLYRVTVNRSRMRFRRGLVGLVRSGGRRLDSTVFGAPGVPGVCQLEALQLRGVSFSRLGTMHSRLCPSPSARTDQEPLSS